ncbi:MAG: hypothetical protein V1493_04930 [Candidatus Diapherotrites archaeon]
MFEFKRVILYSLLISLFLLAIGTASATITVQGDLASGDDWDIYAYEGLNGGTNPCSGGDVTADYNTSPLGGNGGDTAYDDDDDYILSWTPSAGSVDINIWFCEDGIPASNFTKGSVDDGTTVYLDLGRISGNTNAELDDDYVTVCDDFNGNRMSDEVVQVNIALVTDFAQYFAFEDGVVANQKVFVFFDNDTSNDCIWDETKTAGREINTTSAHPYENYGVAAEFGPETKAQGYLHNDFDFGWMAVYNSYIGGDGNTDKLMTGMAKFGDLGATAATRYTLYYDDTNAGSKYKVKLFKSADIANAATINTVSDMNILQVAASFTSLDANIKINGDMPTELDLVSSIISTVDYQTTDIDSTPADYNLYVPVSTPTLKYWDAGAFKYAYTYGGAINSDQTLNISRVSGEAHSALETYTNTSIELFTDNTCGTEVTQGSGDPNYRVHPADTAGVDYNIYFTGNDGTYYSLVWYNDGSGDFNTCGNAVTVASQVATKDLNFHLSGQVPTGAFTNVYIDYGQNGFTVGTDANTDDINAGGFYHVFGISDAAVDILFYNSATQELSKTKDFSSDVTLNVAKVSGDTHAQANDGDLLQDLRVYSDSACAVTELSSRNGTPWSGNNPDYNQFYESSGAGSYYAKLDVNIDASDNVYTSCIKFAGTGNGADDTLNLARQLTGQIPTGVSTVAVDLTETGDYNARTSDFIGATPDITYYLYMETDVDATADVNFLNVSGTVLLTRNGVLNADETLDVSRIIGDAHANLQEGTDTLEICNSIACTTKYSSETVNPAANGGADDDFNVYYEVAAAGSTNIFLHITDDAAIDLSSFADADVLNGGAIGPGETDTIDLTQSFAGATVSEIAWIWADVDGIGDEDGTWALAADTNQTAYKFYHGYTGATDANVKADEDNDESNGVNLELTQDLSAVTVLNIDAIRGDVPTTFQGETFEVETAANGNNACGGARYGGNGGTDAIPADVTAQTYDYYLYVEADGTAYSVIACTGTTKQLKRSETAGMAGNSYYDVNIAKVSGEISADFDNGEGSSDTVSIYSDSGCSTTLLSSESTDIAIVVGGDDYNGFYEVSGTGAYYIKAVDSGASTYTSCIKFTSTGNGGTDALNLTRKIVATTPAAVTKISISTTNDVNTTTDNAGDFNIYTTSGTAADRIYALNATPAVVLQRTIDLTGDATWDVGAVTGNAHAGLQETNVRDNVEVYDTGPATCGTLLSSEDVVIAATYTQYYESDSAGNVYIKVTDSNSEYDYNTCIDTETGDTAGASASFDLDMRLAGYVGSGITIIRVDRAQDGDEAYSTVVTDTTPDSYISYSPGNNPTDVSFYAGATLELDRTGKNSTADLMINVGKLQGETHATLETGGDDDVRVYSTITNNACATELSSHAENPADTGGVDFTQYFEATDGAYDNTFYFPRYSAVTGGQTYVTCHLDGFKTTNLEYASADSQRQVSGTVPDASAGNPDIAYVMSDVNGTGNPAAATAPVDGGASTAYYLFLDSGAAGAGDDVNFYSDAAGTVQEFGKTTSLASDATINVSLVTGETGTALEGGTDSVAVCASGLPNTYTDTTCDSYSSTRTQYPGENAGVDYNVFFEQSANTVYFMQIKDMNDFGGQNWGGSDHNFYSYNKFTSAAAGSRIELDLNANLTGYLYEEYNMALPILDVNVNLVIGANPQDWNSFTFTNVDGNYSAYGMGPYDFKYSKAGHTTRDWTTNAGEMNDIMLSATVDTNLLNGVIVTVKDDAGNNITDATVEVVTSTSPITLLTGCTSPAGNCTRTGDNTAGNGSSGKYYFSGFTMPQTVWVRAYKTGWETATSPPADASGQSVTSTSNYEITVYINDSTVEAPSLNYPGDYNYLNYNTPTFTWFDVGADEVDYNIMVDDTSTFASPLINTDLTGGNDIDYDAAAYGSLPDGRYYWKVAAIDLEGTGYWSVIRTFWIDTNLPTAPTLTAINSGNQANLAWTAGSDTTTGISYYNVYARYEADPTATTTYRIVSGLENAEYSYSPQQTGTWHFGVTAVDLAGNESAISTVKNVEIDLNAPTGVTVLIADGNLYTASTTVKLDVNGPSATTCEWSIDNLNWNVITCGTPSTADILPSGDGVKTVYGRATDGNQNVTNASDTITLDSTSPSTPTAVYPQSAMTTNNTSQTWTWSAATDATSGIDYYDANLYIGTTLVYTNETSGTSVTYDLNVDNTAYILRVTAVDKAGNNSGTLEFSAVTTDFTGPVNASVIINSGSTYTTSPTVTFDINALGASACYYRFDDSSDWNGTGVTCTGTGIIGTLPGDDGVKTIYVRVTDGQDNNVEVTDTIILDQAPPSDVPGTSATKGGLGIIKVGWDTATDTPAAGGINYYIIYRDTTDDFAITDSKRIGSSNTIEFLDSNIASGVTYYYKVTAVDLAGNEDTTTSTQAMISIDFIAPIVGSPIINGGATYTQSINTTLALVAYDETALNTCEASNDFSSWTDLGAYATTESWALLNTGDGLKTVYYRCTDTSSNTSTPESATITLDSNAPSNPAPTSPSTEVFTGTTAMWEWTGSTDATSGVNHYNIVILKDGSAFKDLNVYPETFLTLSGLNEGIYTAAVTTIDNAGNTSSTMAFGGTFTVDITLPSATFTSPTISADTNDAQPDFNFSVSDNNTVAECVVTPYLNGAAQASVTTTPVANACGYTFSARGNFDTTQIGVVVVDDANNRSDLVLSPVLTVDTGVPSVIIYTPSDSTILSDTTPEVYFIADDDVVGGSGLDWSRFVIDINGVTVPVADIDFDCSVTDSNIAFYCYFDVPAAYAFTDGVAENYISVTVVDMAGNYSATDTVTDLNVDLTDYITLNAITAVNTNGQADDTNTHAWKWDFNTTFGVGSIGDDKNKLRFKLDNWTSATTSTTLYVDGNAEMVYDANVAGVQTTMVYNIKTTYDTTQTVYQFWDHNPLTTAIDANFYVQQRIPSSIAAGQYSTTYGIKSYAS